MDYVSSPSNGFLFCLAVVFTPRRSDNKKSEPFRPFCYHPFSLTHILNQTSSDFDWKETESIDNEIVSTILIIFEMPSRLVRVHDSPVRAKIST